MKKIITVLTTLLFLVSCSNNDTREKVDWEITYTVYYTSEINKTFTTIVSGHKDDEPELTSSRGTNKLYLLDNKFPGLSQKIYFSTAPIELVSYKIIEK